MKLTKTVVDRAKYQGEGRNFYALWDDEVSGFGLRIHPSGKRTFIVTYRAAGQKKFFVIGPADVLTAQAARNRARIELGRVSAGANPQAERTRQRECETIDDLCEAYMDRHAKPRKRTWKADQGRIDLHILPAWRGRKAQSVSRADVAALHREIATKPRPMKDRNGQVVMRPELDAEGKPVLKDGRPVMHPVMRHGAPYEANRTLEVVKKMFFLAQVWGFVPEDFRNPAVGIERFKETKRERWITHEELPELAKAIDAENNVYARAAVWLYLFTGCRRSELLGAKWEQVDETRCELFLPTTKAGRAFTVPLSPPAMSILSSLPRIAGNPFIFPSLQPRGERKEPGHLVNIDKAWRRVRKAAGVADVRLHDLRRTVGSWLAMDGASLLVIGKTLNQTSPATTAVYARLSQDPVRAALDKHAKRILAIVKPKRKSKAKVTNLAQWRGSKG